MVQQSLAPPPHKHLGRTQPIVWSGGQVVNIWKDAAHPEGALPKPLGGTARCPQRASRRVELHPRGERFHNLHRRDWNSAPYLQKRFRILELGQNSCQFVQFVSRSESSPYSPANCRTAR